MEKITQSKYGVVMEIENDEKFLTKSCKKCRHFCPFIYELSDGDPNSVMESDYGECRRFPPKIVDQDESCFPVIHEEAWCGEFDF
jgi:hypothetical protein